MALLDNLEVKATGSMDDALKKLDELLSKVRELPKSKTTNLRVNTTNTTTEIRKVSDNVKRVVGEIDRGAKQIQKSTSKAADSALSKIGQLFSSIKRIAYYRLIRSAIKAVTQGFQEGIQNAYDWAVANNDAFQQVMDTYATKSLYLKNTMGALASTVLTALLPAFTWLVDKIVKGANWLNEFIAALSGADWFLRAKEVATQFGDAVEEAAGAQKELNQQLMAFDELNVITTPKNRGRGDDDSVLDGFERVNVSEKFAVVKKLGEKIREIFGNLTEPFDKIKGYAKDIWDYFEKIGVPEAVSKVFDGLKKTAESIFNFIKNVVERLGAMGFAEKFSQDLKNILEKFGDIFEKVGNIQERLDNLGVSDALAGALAMILSIVEGLTASSILEGLTLIADTLDVIDRLLSGDFAGALNAMKSLFIDFMSSLIRPIVVVIDAAEKAIASFAKTESMNILANFERLVSAAKGETGGGASRLAKNNTSTGGGTLVVKREPTGLGLQNAKNGSSSGRSVLDSMTIDLRANGGFPEMGSIFAAGESGAEFVGNINGRTGVASGQEITGIADAVYATGNEEASLLRELVAVVKAGGGSMQPSAAFGRFASQSIRLYKGVTG